MRYHIDTIPVWDALKLDGECPLCALRRKTELIDVDRFLGASVMEPDTRIQVNDRGFCRRHQALLYAQQNRLGHALMMHSHVREVLAKAVPLFDQARAAAKKEAEAPALKRAVGKGGGKEEIAAAAKAIGALSDRCIICDSIDENVRRYAYTLLHLYKTDPAFSAAFAASKGVCLPDMAMLMDLARQEMNGSLLSRFIDDLCAAVQKSLEKNEKDLEGFTLKFDYRNTQKPWGDSRDSLERTVNKLRGWCIGGEPNPK